MLRSTKQVRSSTARIIVFSHRVSRPFRVQNSGGRSDLSDGRSSKDPSPAYLLDVIVRPLIPSAHHPVPWHCERTSSAPSFIEKPDAGGPREGTIRLVERCHVVIKC